MIDSVFDAVLFNETPFPNDVPLIPLENIQSGLDRVEDQAIAGQMAEIEREGDRVLFQGLRAVDRGDIQAINELDWGLSGALQRPIYQLWESGYQLGGIDMLAEMRSVVPQNFARFISAEVAAALQQMLQLQPAILFNTAAQTAVLNRVIAIAGNFSRDLLNQLKLDLVSAIVPQPTTGLPISRRQLLDRIQRTLTVSRSRASNISRTETGFAYNTGRIATAQQSELVEAFRFLSIDDSRTTDICRSRNGLILKGDQIQANRPPLHFSCRSVLSPVMPRISKRHKAWTEDPLRNPSQRVLAPLSKGWQN
ncbi:MAG: minor capsid protein [Cyanobacteria bacterium P01_A01_bin.123]